MNRVLIVDDKSENLYLLGMLMRGHGFEVEEAVHGAEALLKARRNPPTLVVSDLLMPVMDGYSLLKHWKADERLRGIPFVVYTATYTDARDERLAVNLGADAFIVKPAEPEAFMARIHAVLAKAADGSTPADGTNRPAEGALSQDYSEVVVRKLEQKILQVGQANAALTAEIAQRTRVEAELRLTEERYRTLIAATSAIVWNTPASGDFESAPTEWMAFTGQTFEQCRGRGWLGAVHPDDRDATERVWTAARAQRKPYYVEHRLRRADGTYRQMAARAFPISAADGTPREWIGVHVDVTDQKRAEAELQLRERAIRAATQGLLITDPASPDNGIVYANPGFERITGYSAAEVRGRNLRFLQGKDTDRDTVASLREAVRAGRPCTVEFLNYRKDGTPFWNELSISPIRDGAGKLTHFVGVQADVTARHCLQEQLRQVQKMEAIGRLAGGVAHDFNNLLTIINGYSEVLLATLPPDDPNRSFLDEIHKAGVRSAELTRQLLAFSRQQVLAPRTLNLNAVVGDTDKMLRRLIGEDVRLFTSLESNPWMIRADPGQIEQVLMNLAVNARDAMPQGGRLTIETRNVELDGEYVAGRPDAREGPHALLSVTDTGTGMPADIAARIFEPFFTTKGPGKGTGLGLATVYGIVKQSGGHVTVYSEVGVGTTFKVYLPRAGETTESPSRVQPRALPRGTETVLLVEDDAGVRALGRRMLTDFGYSVLEAGDGDEAVRVAAECGRPIRLLITDVVMPGAGGRVVAQRVTAIHPETRVLFVSGYTDDAVVRHGILEEKIQFLAKPFTAAALANKVRDVLDRKDEPA